jgi:hypothetical protein
LVFGCPRRPCVFIFKTCRCLCGNYKYDDESVDVAPPTGIESVYHGDSTDNGCSRADLSPVDIHSARLGDRPHEPGDRRLPLPVLRRGLVNCHAFRPPLVAASLTAPMAQCRLVQRGPQGSAGEAVIVCDRCSPASVSRRVRHVGVPGCRSRAAAGSTAGGVAGQSARGWQMLIWAGAAWMTKARPADVGSPAGPWSAAAAPAAVDLDAARTSSSGPLACKFGQEVRCGLSPGMGRSKCPPGRGHV